MGISFGKKKAPGFFPDALLLIYSSFKHSLIMVATIEEASKLVLV